MLVLTVMVHMLMCAPMGFITPRPHFGSCVFPAEKWERDSNKVARKMGIVLRRSGDGFAWYRLGTGFQAIKLSPHHAGLAGLQLQRLPSASRFSAMLLSFDLSVRCYE